MNFSERIKKSTANHQMLLHPFYQAWMRGELSMSALRNYAVQYTPFVDQFPCFVSRIHSQAPDTTSRRQLLANLAEEEGYPNGTDHPSLWQQFAQGLGMELPKMKEAGVTKTAQDLVQIFWDQCHSSYAEGLGALYSYEHQIPEVSRFKIKGLAEHYGINSKSAIEFFAVHETADELHSQSCGELLNSLTPREQEKALVAAQKASEALWNFLSSCHEEKSCLSLPN